MELLRVIKYGNPILRLKAEKVEQIDDSIHKLIDDMIATMQENEGIGLAATQVARTESLFVIDMSLIENDGKPMAIINPEILETKGLCSLEEGCLSFPDLRQEVKRPEIIRVRYMDENGEQHEEEIDGYKARVFQHEIDHLNGVLFVDRVGSMKRKLLQKQLKKIAEEELAVMDTEEAGS